MTFKIVTFTNSQYINSNFIRIDSYLQMIIYYKK